MGCGIRDDGCVGLELPDSHATALNPMNKQRPITKALGGTDRSAAAAVACHLEGGMQAVSQTTVWWCGRPYDGAGRSRKGVTGDGVGWDGMRMGWRPDAQTSGAGWNSLRGCDLSEVGNC